MRTGAVAIRLSKVVITAGLSLWAALVTLGNVANFDSYLPFVQHVLSMDTIFADSVFSWRAITNPAIHTAAYVAITATEALMALAFLVATVQMGTRLAAPKEVFQRVRTFVAFGVILGFGLLFIGFLVIAGEWFVMWQSSQWNAQEPAFRMCMIILACGIYVFLDNDGDVDGDRSERD